MLAWVDRALHTVFSPFTAAVLVLRSGRSITGAIHLDGLADCLDGLGGRDREHRLTIMRDSRIGVFGAVGLVFYLLIAFAAVAETPAGLRGRILLMAPMVGRLAPLLIARRFDAATPGQIRGRVCARALPVGWPGSPRRRRS